MSRGRKEREEGKREGRGRRVGGIEEREREREREHKHIFRPSVARYSFILEQGKVFLPATVRRRRPPVNMHQNKVMQ